MGFILHLPSSKQWYYIHTQIYILTKKLRRKFAMQMVLANQSSGRCFPHMKIKKQKQKQTKNQTSNQNRVRLFFTRERSDASDKKPQRCVSFAPKFPPFIQYCLKALVACSASVLRIYFADIQGEKIFSQISSLRKLRSISKIG